MSTLLLFILFAFIAVAIWLGYAGYRSMQKKRGPVPPPQTEEGAKPLSRRGAPPTARKGVHPEGEAGLKRPENQAGPKRPEGEAGPKRTEGEAGPKRPEDEVGPKGPTKRNPNEPDPPNKRRADDGA